MHAFRLPSVRGEWQVSPLGIHERTDAKGKYKLAGLWGKSIRKLLDIWAILLCRIVKRRFSSRLLNLEIRCCMDTSDHSSDTTYEAAFWPNVYISLVLLTFLGVSEVLGFSHHLFFLPLSVCQCQCRHHYLRVAQVSFALHFAPSMFYVSTPLKRRCDE